MTPYVSLYFIAFFALFQVVITNLVGARRVQTGIQFYDEGDLSLRRNMRAHANFTETVPITLIAMFGAEIAGTPASLLIAGGFSLLIGRCLHYWIIRRHGWGRARAISMVLTFLPMGGFALAILWQLTTV